MRSGPSFRLWSLAAGQLAILLVCLVVADLILLLVAPFDPDGPLEVEFAQTIDGVKRDITFRTIGHYVRSVSVTTLAKPRGSLRLLCLGASTTEQSPQQSEDTWCALLEKKLRTYPDIAELSFHAVSYGKGGDTARQTAVWMRRMFDIIQPDVVVTLVGINDVTFSGGPGFTVRTVDEEFIEQPETIRSRVRDVCLALSQICRRSRQVWQNLELKRGIASGKVLEWHSEHLQHARQQYRKLRFVEAPLRSPDPLDEFRASVAWLLGDLRKRGVAVVVLGQPVLWKPQLEPEEFSRLWFPVATSQGFVRPSPAWLASEMKRFNDAQKEEATKAGARYLDLDGLVPKTLDYFIDDCHFTDRGSTQVASLASPIVREALVRR